MSTTSGGWIALFSGGKDSSYALYRALERGLDVRRLLTVHPPEGSYMYHVPATDLAELAAETIAIPLEEVTVRDGDLGVDESTAPGEIPDDGDSGTRGDAEVQPLEATLRRLDGEIDGGVAGVVLGAVESEFQLGRVEGVCDRLDCDLYAPLWRGDPRELAEAMLEAGFEIRIVEVAAAGLDASWLGRVLDEDAVDELEALGEKCGVHLLGEGGEYETLVTDGPHMTQPISITYTTEWDGTRGRIRVTDAQLG